MGRAQTLISTALKLAAGLEVEIATLLDGITYRPQFFSAAPGEFGISARPLFDLDTPGKGQTEGGTPMTVADQFGQNVRAARRDAALSQDDRAARSGLHHTEISLIERGLRLPDSRP